MRRAFYYTLWRWWHIDLRYLYDLYFNHGRMLLLKDRPWWQMCCNGDMGGWRTKVCNHLEHKWRDLDRQAEPSWTWGDES